MKLNGYKKKVLLLAALFLVALYVSKYWYQFMLIQGESMEPSYHNGQLVLLDKNMDELTRGDVIAFYCEAMDSILVKRIVAVPEDVVLISNGVLYINGEVVKEETQAISYAGRAESEITLSEKEYFVLGDNYEKSKDSRYEKIGNIQYTNIIGKVIPQR